MCSTSDQLTVILQRDRRSIYRYSLTGDTLTLFRDTEAAYVLRRTSPGSGGGE